MRLLRGKVRHNERTGHNMTSENKEATRAALAVRLATNARTRLAAAHYAPTPEETMSADARVQHARAALAFLVEAS